MKVIIKMLIASTLLCGCKANEATDDISMELSRVKLYLKAPLESDAELPPKIMLSFNIKNLSDYSILFIAKSRIGDDRRSRLLAIDTSNNIGIPIYSNSIATIEEHKSSIVEGAISFHDIAEYLNLDSNILNKIDYSSDTKYLQQLTERFIDNTIMIYVSDTTDIKRYSLLNIKEVAVKTPVVLIKKPSRFKLSEY